MTFKEQIKQEVATVFLNEQEFAEVHDIEGQSVLLIMDKDVYNQMSGMNFEGVYQSTVALFIKTGTIERPVVGQIMRLDGNIYLVRDCR
jgi:hypothetical protein